MLRQGHKNATEIGGKVGFLEVRVGSPNLGRIRKSGIDTCTDCFGRAPLREGNGTLGGEPEGQVAMTWGDWGCGNRGGAADNLLGSLGSGSGGLRGLPLHDFHPGAGSTSIGNGLDCSPLSLQLLQRPWLMTKIHIFPFPRHTKHTLYHL